MINHARKWAGCASTLKWVRCASAIKWAGCASALKWAGCASALKWDILLFFLSLKIHVRIVRC